MTNSKDFHPVLNCNDGYINAISGKKVNLNKPTPDIIEIRDIAGALSKLCRFGGQTNTFYSVAQHSILVYSLAWEDIKKEALLHDASEAYLGDVIKPIKVMLGEVYHDMESNFEHAIAQKFGLDILSLYSDELKEIDRRALLIEHEALQKGNIGPLVTALDSFGLLIQGRWAWSPKEAEALFMGAFNDCFNL